MARSNGSSCSCRHIDDTGSPVQGSGSIVDPYVHESPRFVSIKDPNNNDIALNINENNCVVLPRTVRRVILASNGTQLTPNSLGHIPWPDFMNSFTVEASDVDYANPQPARVTQTISSNTTQTLVVTSIGTPESNISTLFSDGGIGTVLQGDVALEVGNSPSVPEALVSVPQLRTASNLINQIDYPFTQIGLGNGDERVELWPSTRLLAISRNSQVLCHVNFSLEFGPEPVGGFQSFAHAFFDILDANGNVVHKGQFTPELPRIKKYSYFFPLYFTGPSFAQGNGKVEFRVFSETAMPATSTMFIRDILVSYTLI